MKEKLKIVVMIPTSRGFGRSIIKGIARYARYHGRWSLYMDLPDYAPKRQPKKSLDWLNEIGIDGIIARIPCPYELDDLLQTKKPIILTNVINDIETLPSIVPDCEMMAQMGVKYFINKGYKNLAFCGFADPHWCRERAEYFAQFVRQHGYKPHIFFEKSVHLANSGQLSKGWKTEENKMVRWLSELPKPVAILTSNDDMGRHIVQSCGIAGLMVPEEVAVLGGDNDQLVAELCEPQLSSIQLDAESCGYQAAEILQRIIEQKPLESLRVVVEPTHVVTRQSTDVMAIDDPDVAKALNFINNNFKKNIKVTDVARVAATSVRILQMKFKEFLDRSPYAEITRVRIEHATTLLIESNMSISQIAFVIGFEEVKYFTRLFSKTKGISPLAYRKKHVHKRPD